MRTGFQIYPKVMQIYFKALIFYSSILNVISLLKIKFTYTNLNCSMDGF